MGRKNKKGSQGSDQTPPGPLSPHSPQTTPGASNEPQASGIVPNLSEADSVDSNLDPNLMEGNEGMANLNAAGEQPVGENSGSNALRKKLEIVGMDELSVDPSTGNKAWYKDTKPQMNDGFISDGNPPWFFTGCKRMMKTKKPNENIIMYAIYVLLYESGFYFMGGPMNSKSHFNANLMKQLIKSPMMNRATFDSKDKLMAYLHYNAIFPNILRMVSFTIQLKEHTLVINLFQPNTNQLITILLQIDYIIYTKFEENQIYFRKKWLCAIVKNALYALKCGFDSEFNMVNKHISDTMNEPVLIRICKYLPDVTTFINFFSSCKYLSETLRKNKSLWKYFLLQELQKIEDHNFGWKNLYMFHRRSRGEFPYNSESQLQMQPRNPLHAFLQRSYLGINLPANNQNFYY